MITILFEESEMIPMSRHHRFFLSQSVAVALPIGELASDKSVEPLRKWD
jgi:hypothetical protein